MEKKNNVEGADARGQGPHGRGRNRGGKSERLALGWASTCVWARPHEGRKGGNTREAGRRWAEDLGRAKGKREREEVGWGKGIWPERRKKRRKALLFV